MRRRLVPRDSLDYDDDMDQLSSIDNDDHDDHDDLNDDHNDDHNDDNNHHNDDDDIDDERDKDGDASKDHEKQQPHELLLSDMALQEFRALSAYAVLAAVVRIVISDVLVWSAPEHNGSWKNLMGRVLLSFVLPTKVRTGQSPGFIFASGW